MNKDFKAQIRMPLDMKEAIDEYAKKKRMKFSTAAKDLIWAQLDFLSKVKSGEYANRQPNKQAGRNVDYGAYTDER